MVSLFCILLHNDLSCILIFESSTTRVVVWYPTTPHNRKKVARFLIAFFGSSIFVFGFNVSGFSAFFFCMMKIDLFIIYFCILLVII